MATTSLSTALGPCPEWVPVIERKIDRKQVTFTVPLCLIPTARAVFYKRYVEDIGSRPGFFVNWVDQTQDNETIELHISPDLNKLSQNNVPTTLFKTKLQINYGLSKLVTITFFYSTGTILIQGHKCNKWVTHEFYALTEVTRQVFGTHSSDPTLDINNTTTAALSHLPVPTLTIQQSSDVVIEDITDSDTNSGVMTESGLCAAIRDDSGGDDAVKVTAATDDTTMRGEGNDHPSDSTNASNYSDDSIKGGRGNSPATSTASTTTNNNDNSAGGMKVLSAPTTVSTNITSATEDREDLPAHITTTINDNNTKEGGEDLPVPITSTSSDDSTLEGGDDPSAPFPTTTKDDNSASVGVEDLSAPVTTTNNNDSVTEGREDLSDPNTNNNDDSAAEGVEDTSASITNSTSDNSIKGDGENLSAPITTANDDSDHNATRDAQNLSAPIATTNNNNGGATRGVENLPAPITTASTSSTTNNDDNVGTTRGTEDLTVPITDNTDNSLTAKCMGNSCLPATTNVLRQRTRQIRVGGWRSAARPVTLSHIKRKLKNTRKQLAQLTDLCISSTYLVKSIIETNNTQIKSEIKTHVKHKYETQSEQIASLSSKIKTLTDQNNALKSQLTQLRKQFHEDKNTPAPTSKQKDQQTTQMKPTVLPTAHTQTQSQSLLVTANKHASVVQNSTKNISAVTTSSPTNSTTHPPLSPTVAQSAASCSTPPPSAGTTTTEREERSPGQQLAECCVDQRATHLLIGDSPVCPVQPDLLFPQAVSQKLAFPGLTMAELVHWLKHVPRSRHIQSIVAHVGINTCWVNAITESQWRQLLQLFKSVFPSAQLYMSAMVPPRGRHPLWKTVAVSNDALAAVCKTEGAVFVDHTATFCSSNGAPRKALYKDALRPSNEGTVRLAQNIKRAAGPTEFQTKQPSILPPRTRGHKPWIYSSNSRRPPLLPTPIPTHTNPMQRHLTPIQQHPSTVHYHPASIHYHPIQASHHLSPMDYHPTPAHYNSTLIPSQPPRSQVQSSRSDRYVSPFMCQPILQCRQPPSYSDVVRGTRGYPSVPVLLETYV